MRSQSRQGAITALARTALVEGAGQLAERPSLDEVLDQIDARRGGRIGLHQAVQDLDEERTQR